MSKISPSKPHHCFQPLIPGFLYNFSIPGSFLKYIAGRGEDNGEEIVILRDKREINWYIKMDGYHFKDGWKNFCKENNLQVGDFVVLKHQGQLIFDVLIFDPTACEREYRSFTQSSKLITSSSDLHANISSSIPKKMKGMKKKQQEEDKVPSNEEVRFKPSGHPYWLAVNKSGYLTWGGVPIPKAFAAENGLRKRSCEMILTDEKGKSWPMTLRHANSSGTTYIGCWRRFHEAIGLNIGDHLVFELLDDGEKPVIKFHSKSQLHSI
ncbi:hypothetical protein Cgig2_026392 [Carnegiea gigantea]|uniref:TF-B3 domain-containing protein n=1 Tax=Carnegiea gigantea TaxID=171969 RepID=A0A9Q1QBZ1_9CARY|nr:hypothetical protein Cgig2_026392 [Carnegiea gigantea]